MLTLEHGTRFEPGFASDDPWTTLLLIYAPIALAPALFTWLLPAIFGYRRGGMAMIGAGVSVALSIILPLQLFWHPFGDWYYEHIHPWLYGLFYIYAFFGLLLCAVGIYDRKRSAIWALVAMLFFTSAALADTVIWLGYAGGKPWVPFGFIAFASGVVIALIRRPADAAELADARDKATDVRNNATRRSRSIPRTLLRDGNLHLLPVYYILCLSELGREGIQNSGSFRFADHIYRDEPAGITPLGKWLDARLLALPATVAFRERYKQSQLAMRDALERFSDAPGPLRILAIPCGIPRDLKEMADTLERENPSLLERLTYVGMDLDPELLDVARRYLKDCSGRSKTLHRGNALVRAEYPEGKFHAIVSTGLGEFLTDEEICVFYRNVHEALTPGGTFYTSATAREGRSERLMRAFELYTQYRTADKLRILLGELPWKELSIESDQSGLQSFVRATKA